MREVTVNDLLSRREQEILQWLSEGLRDKDIGPLLGLKIGRASCRERV